MQKEVQYRNNPTIEGEKRLNMAYLQLTNPQIIEAIEKNKSCFFHGTNANALPSILKNGINSVDTSRSNNIPVTTGEEWSRFNGKRNFISFTDCINETLSYANMNPNDNEIQNSIFDFGVIIGASFENMEELRVSRVHSDIPEIGVIGNLPVDHIKFLAVPNDKVEFVKKMIGEKDIDVVSMNIKDSFLKSEFIEKLNMLEQGIDNNLLKSNNPIYYKNDIQSSINDRTTSGIKKIFENIKEKWKTLDDKIISGRV